MQVEDSQADDELVLPRVCENKKNQRRREKMAKQKGVEAKRRNQAAKKTSVDQPRRQGEVLQGSEKGPGCRRRRFVGINSCLVFVRTPRDSQTGPSFTRRLSQRGVASMRWREGKGRLGNAEWLRCLGVWSCLVLYWTMKEGGKRQAKLARQKMQR